jgi:hypothetical protein
VARRGLRPYRLVARGPFRVDTRTVGTQDDIWVVPVTPDGHLREGVQPKPYLRTPLNEAAGRFSPEPNPRWIAYQSDESGHDEVYVQSFPEPRGPHRISTNGARAPKWSPNGRDLFYQSPDGKVMAVRIKLGPDSVDASAPRELFFVPPQMIFEVAPDDQRFLVAMPDPAPHPLTVIVNWPSLLKSKATGPWDEPGTTKLRRPRRPQKSATTEPVRLRNGRPAVLTSESDRCDTPRRRPPLAPCRRRRQ